MKARIVEEFITLQGTGAMAGTRQYFVRFGGCSVKKCSIRAVCDEHRAIPGESGVEVDVKAIAARAADVGEWIHITGGEPLGQPEPFGLLVSEAHSRGLNVHLQTSGALPLDEPVDWITVSPKVPPDLLHVRRGHEMVLVDTSDMNLESMKRYADATEFGLYYLQPLWGSPLTPTIAKVHAASESGHDWRFAEQAHKRWGVK